MLLSADATKSATLLEELLDSHQFSPKGLSILPQGTPTNNTEGNGSGYSENDPYDDLAFFTALDPPAFDAADPDPKKSQTDGRLLADALGIAYAPLLTVPHADRTDVLEANAMGTALFPGTLGYWLRNWMKPVVSEQTARQTRSFFTRYVSGRGPLPAVRVGNQPYGILLTSDFSRWKYPPAGQFVQTADFRERIAFLKNLHQLLLKLETSWEGIAAGLPFVGKAAGDPSDTLMNILGLHPTSVEFFQRIGYSDEYLRDQDKFKNKGRYANELASLLFSMPANARLYLRNLGIEETIGTVGTMHSLHVLWQHYVTPLDAPNLVENRPPSESSPLTFNYIDWLAKAATTDMIVNQAFTADPPSALLYLMLRNALLLQLHHGAYEWLDARADFDAPLQQANRVTTVVGVRPSAPSVSKFEMMAVRVEAAEPAHPKPGTSVADWIWSGPPARGDRGRLPEGTKSGRCSFWPKRPRRGWNAAWSNIWIAATTAWTPGRPDLFAQRLQAQRLLRRAAGESGADRGLISALIGWVENVQPRPLKAFAESRKRCRRLAASERCPAGA